MTEPDFQKKSQFGDIWENVSKLAQNRFKIFRRSMYGRLVFSKNLPATSIGTSSVGNVPVATSETTNEATSEAISKETSDIDESEEE